MNCDSIYLWEAALCYNDWMKAPQQYVAEPELMKFEATTKKWRAVVKTYTKVLHIRDQVYSFDTGRPTRLRPTLTGNAVERTLNVS